MARLNSPKELDKARQDILIKRKSDAPCISICAGAGCLAFGASEVIAAFEAEIEKQGLTADVDTKGTGCPGFCERGPVVVIYPEEICYLQVKAEDVGEIVEQTIKENKIVERLLYEDPATGEKAVIDAQGYSRFRSSENRDDRETLMVKHREHMHEAIGLMDGMSGKHMREVMAEHTGSGVKQEADTWAMPLSISTSGGLWSKW